MVVFVSDCDARIFLLLDGEEPAMAADPCVFLAAAQPAALTFLFPDSLSVPGHDAQEDCQDCTVKDHHAEACEYAEVTQGGDWGESSEVEREGVGEGGDRYRGTRV